MVKTSIRERKRSTFSINSRHKPLHHRTILILYPVYTHHMDWPSMEQELVAAKYEIQQLKGKLAKKEDAICGLEMDMNFHALKAQELEGILNNQENPDEIRKKLQIKSIQNAGLTVQVQELRRQLDDASLKRHHVETELKHAVDKIHHLGEERKSHQKMLFEMGDVVRLLGQIDIDYTIDNEDQSSWKGHERTLESIKCKIRALEEDRQNRIQENQELETQLFEKAIELDSYKNQQQLLEDMHEERDRLQRENEELQKAMTTKDEIIQSLKQSMASAVDKAVIEWDSYKNQEKLLENLKEERNRLQRENVELQKAITTRDEFIQSLKQAMVGAIDKVDTIPRNIVCEQFVIYKPIEQSDVEAVLQNDGSTVVVPSTGGSFHVPQGRLNFNSSTEIVCPEDDMCSFSSLESPEVQSKADIASSENQESAIASSEIQESAVVETQDTQLVMLQKELEVARHQVMTIKKKQELREKMLRDVIFQYKELQKEHDAATARLAMLDPSSEGSSTSCSGTPNSPQPIRKNSNAPNQPEYPQLKKSHTFETSTSSVGTTEPVGQSRTGTAIHSENPSLEGSHQHSMSRHEYTDEDYRQLEKEFSRLEHEHDDAAARIANLEEDLSKAKEDLSRAESKYEEKEKEYLELQQQYESLDSDHKAVVEKAAQLREDLDYAQEQASQAKAKRDQREADLWDVIDQYKKLAEENEHTVAKMQGVENQLGETQALVATIEHELALTKRQSKRNDLVYANMRIKQEMEDCRIRMEELERDLRAARADAVRNKEDSKSLRNRLAGSNFQFKQLKAQCEKLMVQKTNLERNLDKAQRQIKILSTKSQSSPSKGHGTRQESINQYLHDEISELHAQHDEEFLTHSSTSIPVS